MLKTSTLEEELLLYCARAHLEGPAAEQFNALLQKDIEWSYLLRLASNHWITPLLYWHLNEADDAAIPSSVMEELKDEFQNDWMRNLFLIGELHAIVELFAANGIPALPYKGAVLAQYAYGNVALRAFSDIDILIDKCDLRKIKELLFSVGYEPSEELNETQEKIYILSGYHYEFEHSSRGTHVEIHWAVWKKGLSLTPSQIGIWERATLTTLFGTDMLITTPEEMLLLACIHGTKHQWQILQLICDVAGLIQAHPELDWDTLLRRAHALGSERMLFLGLLLASDVLGTPLPETVLKTAESDKTAKALSNRITKALFLEPQTEHDTAFRPLTFKDIRFVVLSKERFKDKLRALYSFALLPTLAEYELLALPARLSKLYYVVRPFHLVMRCVEFLLEWSSSLLKSSR